MTAVPNPTPMDAAEPKGVPGGASGTRRAAPSEAAHPGTPKDLRGAPAPDFEKGNGLITVVTQDATCGAVLMVAHMDREAYDKTIQTGEMHYRSRTRGLWHKGATSGNVQRVQSLTLDCDADALLARVIPAGPACHTGSETCFGAALSVGDVLSTLATVIDQRAAALDSEPSSYTQKLLKNRNLRLKKIGEEAAELVLALADKDKERAAEEGADIIYHTLVALAAEGVSINAVRDVLAARMHGK